MTFWASFGTSAIGVVVGIGLKFLADLWSTRRQEGREDVVWRRERFVDAAAGLLEAARAMSGAHSAVLYNVISLETAQSQRQPDASTVHVYTLRLDESHAIFHGHVLSANHQMELLRLYAPDAIVAAAEDLEREANVRPSQYGLLGDQEARVTDACKALTAAVRQVRGPFKGLLPYPARDTCGTVPAVRPSTERTDHDQNYKPRRAGNRDVRHRGRGL